MASSPGSLDTSANSHPTNFTFSNHPFMTTSSFSDLLSETNAGSGFRTGSGVPKFKSLPPPQLPISPPSSYFSIPPGLSPAELLDSPVLLSSNILPSPTTGTFAAHASNWRTNSGYVATNNNNNNYQSVKEEHKNSYSDFSFQTQTRPPPPPTSSFQSSNTTVQTVQEQAWNNYLAPTKVQNDFSSGKSMVKLEYGSSVQSFSSEMGTNMQSIIAQPYNNGGFQQDQYTNHNNNNIKINNNNNNNQLQSHQCLNRRSDDGFNWRKYGQKQVKGSENPRSYYKCTYPNCPTKKKVERSLDGQITEIVYKGNHNHPKPQNTRRSGSSAVTNAIQASNHTSNDIPDQSFGLHGNSQVENSIGTPENSSISMGDDEFDQSSQRSKSGGGDEYDEDEPNAKKWKKEGDNECISAPGSRTVREPRVVVQTTSDIDILDDGYRWRKYGQKVVKGNPNPRSYYKCTNPGCPVRKHVERASHDLRAVITTYEGKHNHNVPAARGSGSATRPLPNNNTNNTTMNNNNHNAAAVMRPTIHHSTNNPGNNNPLHNMRLPTSDVQAPFTLEMLQSSPGSFGFAGYDNSMGSYMNQPQLNDNNTTYSKTKEEPRDDAFFESLLC